MQHTFYWLDYETFGADPVRDRPAQFAGVRTDGELNEIGESLLLYCRPSPDYLPHPEACLITGITPQLARARGLAERDFIARILAELAVPGTCGVGYNSLRFDDEVTRHTLFRNFHDPYEREWRNGNTRWDLIDVLRMTRTLRPQGIEWPCKDDGRPSFRLGDLTRANGIEHGAAHDALADVRATLALARLLRAQQPKLFEYALLARDKAWAKRVLNVVERKPLLHFSSRFPAEQGCAALVVPLAIHPANANSVISCNLLLDPEPLLTLDAEVLRQYLYTRTGDLPPGMDRIPLKEIHINKCPMVVPAAMLDAGAAARWGIDIERCHANLERLNAAPDLTRKLREIFTPPRGREAVDVDFSLYAGSFLAEPDKRLAAQVRTLSPDQLAERDFAFADPRLQELLFRYRARNYPDTLSAPERLLWQEHCTARLRGAGERGLLNCESYHASIAKLRQERATDARAQALLDELQDYALELSC
ncbi:MAG: exodeoxyribonuclease I [Pseudomonadales bacterium]|jgi:exodeoxyribonuclease-1|nr:exodeoxyribonuclease I [Gammaproteobacteria bacterium]MBP6053026.1 exodeoxyribonuclease I [Pseudomonadales bacterium]MBK6583539.1 exodeoxyribonuclease I [Gammaproteobacteria bacterium]MBK7169536.1 exodeoxyribonuclease I [Gammaproteobacteria bacterium]MBK8309414.1 exodeoxyribonuclease I [Gammaproteobacteria bacterium]